MSIMYGTLLRKYESIKDDFGVLSKRYDSLDLLLSLLSDSQVRRYDDLALGCCGQTGALSGRRGD